MAVTIETDILEVLKKLDDRFDKMDDRFDKIDDRFLPFMEFHLPTSLLKMG